MHKPRSSSPKKSRSRSSSPKKSRSPGTGLCVVCKQMRKMIKTKKSKTKKGVNMMRGICPHCGTKMCRFVKSD